MRSRSSLALTPAAVALGLLVLGPVEVARACSACGCGDPTLTQVGVEQPYAGRTRFSLLASHLSYRDGAPSTAVNEQRVVLGLAISPLDWLTLSASLPLVWRETAHPTLAHDTTLGLGDPELRARAVLFRDRAMAPNHLVSLDIGGRFPTLTPMRDGNGLLPLDAQTGTGAFAALLGLTWSVFAGEWSSHTSVLGSVAGEGIDTWRNGPSLRANWQGQWQPSNQIALTLGINTRADTSPSWHGRDQHGAGFVGFVSAGVLVSPVMDLLIGLTARYPVVQVFDGPRQEGPIAELTVVIDAS